IAQVFTRVRSSQRAVFTSSGIGLSTREQIASEAADNTCAWTPLVRVTAASRPPSCPRRGARPCCARRHACTCCHVNDLIQYPLQCIRLEFACVSHAAYRRMRPAYALFVTQRRHAAETRRTISVTTE